jgi:coatomer protein complex subunit alpha (xenin)
LGEEALRQGIYNAYELASQKQKHYDRLNFLYSLQQNRPKLEKILKLGSKTNNSILAFNSALFLNSQLDQIQILRETGLHSLAELAHEAQSGDLSDRLKALGSRPLTPVEPEGEVDFSNWPHTEEEREDD